MVWLPLEIALIFSRVHQLPDGAARTRRAAGLLVGALEFGVIAGALAAGALVEVLAGQLRLVLMIPAVAVTACWFAILFGVPESTERSGGRVDTRGFSLLAVGLLLITSGLTFMRLNGPGAWWPWALVAAGILVFIPFTRYELRREDPLVDIRMLRSKSMWPVQLTAVLFGVSVLGAQAPLSTFARTDPAIHGYGLGLRAGQVSIIIGVYVLALLVGALLYPLVTRRLTPRWTLVCAAVLVGVGYLLFLPFHGSLAEALVNMAIAGIGSGALVAALPSAAAAAAPLNRTAMATGLTNTTKTIGGAFASAVFGIALLSHVLGGAGAGLAPAGAAGNGGAAGRVHAGVDHLRRDGPGGCGCAGSRARDWPFRPGAPAPRHTGAKWAQLRCPARRRPLNHLQAGQPQFWLPGRRDDT